MSAAPQAARVAGAPAPAARPPFPLERVDGPGRARRLAARLGSEWLPRLLWTIDRTGRPGLAGLALLIAAVVFLGSTHLPVVSEVEALSAELAAARSRGRPSGQAAAAPAAGVRELPARADLPAILRQLFREASRAGLAVDTGRYESSETRSSSLVRYRIAFPVTGPYPQIRAFLDSTLAAMPEVALSGLGLERRAISDGEVEAQFRMTVYTAAAGALTVPGAPGADGAADRVIAPAHAAALFAQHSWTVLKPQPQLPPPAAPPPPEPTAPPLPYTLVGALTREGNPPVYVLARGDHVIDAHVGDQLEGVYQLESDAGGQLVFLYLPLNIRQNLAAGVSK